MKNVFNICSGKGNEAKFSFAGSAATSRQGSAAISRQSKLCRYIMLLIFISLSISCGRTGTTTSITKLEFHRGDNYKIGVILPLSGRYSIYGESTLNGIECAVGIFPPCEGPIKAELIIKDDKGLSDIAALAVEELMKKEKVSVIIGPLSSSSIEAAAQKAQELGIPLISLSQKEEITQMGDFAFSVAMTAKSQVKEIVNWAINTKKLKTFAVLYPMTPFGTVYKQLFTEAVRNSNGKIVLSEGYSETTLDFGDIFKKSNAKFDALFIPDSYRAVGYLSSAMLLEGIEGVQLLGISRWNNKEIVERGGKALQGAVFVDGFFDSSKASSVQKFVSMFKQAYKINPTILEAQGFDAARLAAKALQSTGGAHPVDVRNALAVSPDVNGSTGETGFDQNREVIKRMFLLTVKDEYIVELEVAGRIPVPKDKYGDPIENKPENKTPYSPANQY